MNINFKGGYFNFNFFNQIRLDFVQWVQGQCPVSPWTQWTLSSPPGLPGLCSVWLVSLDFVFYLKRYMNINFKGGYFNFNFFNQIRLDFVQWVQGQCPVSPWTQWTLSSPPGLPGLCSVWLVSLDFVDGLTGLCPDYPWTLFRLSTESMVNVHWVHGQCPGSPLSLWTFYRWAVLSDIISWP